MLRYNVTASTWQTYLPFDASGNGKTLSFFCGVVNCNDFGDWSGSGAATALTSSITDPYLRMGATVDAEATVTADAAASADDATGGDDEDGVTMPAAINQGATVSIPVNVYNNTGSTAYLNAWIDFNNDGVFNDTLVSGGGERLEAARTIVTSTSASTQTITFTVPVGASVGTQRGARFRLTNQTTTTPTGAAGAGEIED